MASNALTFHPLAHIFPLLEGEEFTALTEDIRQRGIREAAWVYDSQILDGRNRYRACETLGIECPTRVYDGDDPVGFVVSVNPQHQKLNSSQRAMKKDQGHPR